MCTANRRNQQDEYQTQPTCGKRLHVREQLLTKRFKVKLTYPNPTSGIVSIQCDEEIANVIVRDMSANRIYEGNSSNFDISFASPAMYFVEIQLKSGQNVIKKLIKK